MGWEARAIDAWLSRQLSTVPSHLLPPVSTIYNHVVHHALRPATHLPHSSGISELRRLARARALAEGTADQLKATVAELTPLLQRRFAASGGAKGAARKLRLAAKGLAKGSGKDKHGGDVGGEAAPDDAMDIDDAATGAEALAEVEIELDQLEEEEAGDGRGGGGGGRRGRKRGKKGRGGGGRRQVGRRRGSRRRSHGR